MIKRGEGRYLVILLFVSLIALPGAYASFSNGATCSSDSQCQSVCCRSGACGDLRLFYLDGDRDGRTGATSTVRTECRPPDQYWAARQDNDCRDDDNTVYPGATEICDSKDNDCDGQTDEACGQPDGFSCSADTQCFSRCCRSNVCGQLRRFYWDGDLDSKTGNTKSYSEQCVPYDNHWAARQDNDCRDDDPAVYPGASEFCDRKDNNCDGVVDEGCAPVNNPPTISSVSTNGRIAGQPTTVSVSASDPEGGIGGVVQYNYRFGYIQSGQSAESLLSTSSNSRTFTWNTPGTYSIFVDVFDSQGAKGSWSGSVTIESPPASGCLNGQKQCASSGSGRTPGTIQTCSSGAWDPAQNCGFSSSCQQASGYWTCSQTAKLCANNQCQEPSDADKQNSQRTIRTFCGLYTADSGACKTSCTSNADCVEAYCTNGQCSPTELDCRDGVDNNRNGAIDCADTSCNLRTCGSGSACQQSLCKKLDGQTCSSTSDCFSGSECKQSWSGSGRFCVASTSCMFLDLYDSGRTTPALISSPYIICAKNADPSRNNFGFCNNGDWAFGSCSAQDACYDAEPHCRSTSQLCTLAAWSCGAWNACAGGTQTRACTLIDNVCSNPNGVKPPESQTCTATECTTNCDPCTSAAWSCTGWNSCSGGTRTRNCGIIDNRCTNPGIVKPSESESCSTACQPGACSLDFVNYCDSSGSNGCSPCSRTTNQGYNMCGLNQAGYCGNEGNCGDGLDNDCDGNADCVDTDCIAACGDSDNDGDGLRDSMEQQLGTNPNLRDTDGDGLNDGLEIDTYRTNPLNPDTDHDGVSDGLEVSRGTDPTDPNNGAPPPPPPPPTQTENCLDRIDNDGDGRIDCQDADCPSTAGLCFLSTCSATTFQWTAVARCAGTRDSCGCQTCEVVNDVPGTVRYCDASDLTKTFRTDSRGRCENNVIRYSTFRTFINCASNERCNNGQCVTVITDASGQFQFDTDGDVIPDTTDLGPGGADYSRDADNDGFVDRRFGGSDDYICVKTRQTECCDLQGSVDEDCNGQTNEGCDRDGDGWIDANAEVCQ